MRVVSGMHFIRLPEKGNIMSSDFTLNYIFDPLCGWCYASAPALAAMANQYGEHLTMRPSGLFNEPRPVSAIAEHAWTNDQRIGEMTGQTYTSSYHQNVLLAPDGVFSSRMLTRALVALGQIERGLEPHFLHDAQRARYIDGQDTSRPEVVAEIAAAVAQSRGHAVNAEDLLTRLKEDTDLHRATEDRINETQSLMREQSVSRVPRLIIQTSNGSRIIDGDLLYAGGDAILSALSGILPPRGDTPLAM
jgi:putative protein-disulfide isomerase